MATPAQRQAKRLSLLAAKIAANDLLAADPAGNITAASTDQQVADALAALQLVQKRVQNFVTMCDMQLTALDNVEKVLTATDAANGTPPTTPLAQFTLAVQLLNLFGAGLTSLPANALTLLQQLQAALQP